MDSEKVEKDGEGRSWKRGEGRRRKSMDREKMDGKGSREKVKCDKDWRMLEKDWWSG